MHGKYFFIASAITTIPIGSLHLIVRSAIDKTDKTIAIIANMMLVSMPPLINYTLFLRFLSVIDKYDNIMS